MRILVINCADDGDRDAIMGWFELHAEAHVFYHDGVDLNDLGVKVREARNLYGWEFFFVLALSEESKIAEMRRRWGHWCLMIRVGSMSDLVEIASDKYSPEKFRYDLLVLNKRLDKKAMDLAACLAGG